MWILRYLRRALHTDQDDRLPSDVTLTINPAARVYLKVSFKKNEITSSVSPPKSEESASSMHAWSLPTLTLCVNFHRGSQLSHAKLDLTYLLWFS